LRLMRQGSGWRKYKTIRKYKNVIRLILKGDGRVFSWINRSLKYKTLVVLVIFSIIPLITLGASTYFITTRILENKLNSLANQTIDKLAQYITRDFQPLYDLTYNYSKNNYIFSLLKSPPKTDNEKQYIYYSIKSQIDPRQIMDRLNSLFHYIIVSKDRTVYTNFSYSSKGIYKDVLDRIVAEKWYKDLSSSYSDMVWMGTRPNYMQTNGGDQVYIACNIVNGFENTGVIIMGVDKYYVSKLLNSIRLSERSSIYIVDNEGRCLVEGDDNYYRYEKLPSSFITLVSNSADVPKYADIFNKRQMVIHKRLVFKGVDNSWQVLMITPVEDIRRDIRLVNYVTLLMVVISLIAISFLVMLVNREIINPIIQLNKLTKEVKQGNLDVSAYEIRQDEIGQLGNGFNSMVCNLRKYIQSIHEEEKSKRDIEIKMLQNQIKPHFLRNTLITIRWMAEMKKATGISRALNSLTTLLDYNFKDMDTMATVREEIAYLEEYIYLQKLRHHNKFSSKISIDTGIMDCKILKLSFQPIVENSITHGLSKKQSQGKLEVEGYREEDRLVFIIRDDGVGMDEGTLKNIFEGSFFQKSQGKFNRIGIANVQKRIKMHFGESYGLEMESRKGEGTRVKIIFPVING